MKQHSAPLSKMALVGTGADLPIAGYRRRDTSKHFFVVIGIRLQLWDTKADTSTPSLYISGGPYYMAYADTDHLTCLQRSRGF